MSLANPWVDFLPPQAALRVASEVNDELQRMSELSRGRIFGFGAIAAHAAKAEKGQGGGGGGDGARAVVRELERVASMSGMRGIILGAHELVGTVLVGGLCLFGGPILSLLFVLVVQSP